MWLGGQLLRAAVPGAQQVEALEDQSAGSRGRMWEGSISQAYGPSPQPTLTWEQKTKSE